MIKKVLLVVAVMFAVCALNCSFAADDTQTVVKGKVESIAADAGNIVVAGQKISVTKEFLEDAYLDVGDEVEITAKKTPQGLEAVNYEYVYEEEPAAKEGAESTGEVVTPAPAATGEQVPAVTSEKATEPASAVAPAPVEPQKTEETAKPTEGAVAQ